MKNIVKVLVIAIFAALSMTSCKSTYYADKTGTTKINGPAAKQYCKKQKVKTVNRHYSSGYSDYYYAPPRRNYVFGTGCY